MNYKNIDAKPTPPVVHSVELTVDEFKVVCNALLVFMGQNHGAAITQLDGVPQRAIAESLQKQLYPHFYDGTSR